MIVDDYCLGCIAFVILVVGFIICMVSATGYQGIATQQNDYDIPTYYGEEHTVTAIDFGSYVSGDPYVEDAVLFNVTVESGENFMTYVDNLEIGGKYNMRISVTNADNAWDKYNNPRKFVDAVIKVDVGCDAL